MSQFEILKLASAYQTMMVRELFERAGRHNLQTVTPSDPSDSAY